MQSILAHERAYSSIAQLVERSAVNRVVVGSSPTRGARALSENKSKTQFEVSAKPAGRLSESKPEAKLEVSRVVELEHQSVQKLNMAPWPSGKAKVCNTSITGSIPVGAS